jgi:acyl-CoA thioester hydrolase
VANTFHLQVRVYEIDLNGHLTGAAYIQHADQARWECSKAAGVTDAMLRARGVGPINLETTVRFLRELRKDDEVTITTDFEWGEGRTFRVLQEFHKADGTLVAEVTSVCGMFDLKERRLLSDPPAVWRSLVTDPSVFGL